MPPCLPRSSGRAASTLALVVLSAWGPARAQTPADAAPFVDRTRVTAVDVIVSTPLRTAVRAARGASPGDLELAAAASGDHLTVLGLTSPKEVPVSWTQVLYFDASLSAPGAVPWAAELLASKATELTKQGPVEVVVADPSPRRTAGPTRDPEVLELALSGLAFVDPGDGELVSLRREALDAEATAAELSRRQVESESEIRRRVRERQDVLLGHVVDRSTASPGRIVYWITSGYEGSPGTSGAADTPPFAADLAAYGWVVVPLLRPPPEDPLVEGVRIGKLRITSWSLLQVEAVWEEDRRPELARAFYDLGLSLEAEGDLEDAELALRQALRHFERDPRTASEQAAAWKQLAQVLRDLGREEEARRAYGQIEQIREWLAEDDDSRDTLPPFEGEPLWEARIRSPEQELEELARATGGELVRGESELDDFLGSLSDRFVVTLQLTGADDGSLRPLELSTPRGTDDWSYPGWIRRGNTERYAEARSLRVLNQEVFPEDLPLEIDVEVVSRTARHVDLLLYPPTVDESLGTIRWTFTTIDPDASLRHRHEVEPEGERRERTRIPVTPEEGLLIATVEDLESGAWGARIVDLPSVE